MRARAGKTSLKGRPEFPGGDRSQFAPRDAGQQPHQFQPGVAGGPHDRNFDLVAAGINPPESLFSSNHWGEKDKRGKGKKGPAKESFALVVACPFP